METQKEWKYNWKHKNNENTSGNTKRMKIQLETHKNNENKIGNTHYKLHVSVLSGMHL